MHELVHAYDECRGKDFDWTNCRHIACSEVRLASHSLGKRNSVLSFALPSYVIFALLGTCSHSTCVSSPDVLGMQIRAARLSGDCSMWMEFKRGNLPWPGYEKACVRRRAELSVASMSHCKLSSLAAVLSNFDACYNDTTPFSRPP